jgi:hypothetical protein
VPDGELARPEIELEAFDYRVGPVLGEGGPDQLLVGRAVHRRDVKPGPAHLVI